MGMLWKDFNQKLYYIIDGDSHVCHVQTIRDKVYNTYYGLHKIIMGTQLF